MSIPSSEVPDMQPRTRSAAPRAAPAFSRASFTRTDISLQNAELSRSLVGQEMLPLPASRSPDTAGAATEARNTRTDRIDTVPTLELLRMLNAEDALVAPAVARVLPDLAVVVDATVARLQAGGRVHYFGAGSSGRIGMLDAAEVVPTFGAGPGVFVAHHAGGPEAGAVAVETAEDDEALGAAAAAGLGANDVAGGLTASGRTPFVAGGPRRGPAGGAPTLLGCSTMAAPLVPLA